MKHVAVVFAVLAAALGIAACGGVSNSSSTSASSGSGSGTATESKPTSHKSSKHKSREKKPAKQKPVEPPEPTATASQGNALQAAESYLEYTAFSKSGLEKQLKFEGYSSADAKYGAANIDANWNEQAAKAAKAYLEYTSFSESGLLQQLEFEGFTSSQAQYGVSKSYH